MDAYIVEAMRTPIGKSHKDKGSFRNVRADELMAHLLREMVHRGVDPKVIDDVYVGCVAQHMEQGKNIARLATLLAEYPESVPGVTINRLCGSSLQALNYAAQTVSGGGGDAILAGGVEHMDHLPMTAQADYNPALMGRFEFPFNNMGLTAERVAEREKISRDQQDRFALRSHEKAVLAQEKGYFSKEIVPMSVGGELVDKDQGPRKESSLETLATLKTVFKESGGTVTAGNSSQISDGASLTLISNKKMAQSQGWKVRARVRSYAVVGLDPLVMGLGPIPAIRKLLSKEQLTVKEIDLFEINEAFASQALACLDQLEIPEDKVNPCGGAIALGHPLGATGTRLIVTLLHNMERLDQRLGVASMCIGHGQGIATLIERTT